jgi:hypothetical protein
MPAAGKALADADASRFAAGLAIAIAGGFVMAQSLSWLRIGMLDEGQV